VTIHIDTSALIGALVAERPALPKLMAFAEAGDRLMLSTIVLYEWLRGPRTRAELALQEELFPREQTIPFGPAEAAAAARLYASVKRPRGRESDLAIAACVVVHGGALWTLNRDDFKDIPDLRLA
jgi:predicted nucleic acid-binding protein